MMPLPWGNDQVGNWSKCVVCGSDSSDLPYPDGLYNDEWVADEVNATGGMDARRLSVRSNCDWYPHYQNLCDGMDFLDVGCCDGAAMLEMASLGYRVHGFDVCKAAEQPGCTTISPFFAASLFPRQYDQVMCREVIEHVEGPRQFLVELVDVTKRGGLLQLQTPRPTNRDERIVYQRAHLQIYSPVMLERNFRELGLHVLDKRIWATGQCYLMRKIDCI